MHIADDKHFVFEIRTSSVNEVDVSLLSIACCVSRTHDRSRMCLNLLWHSYTRTSTHKRTTYTLAHHPHPHSHPHECHSLRTVPYPNHGIGMPSACAYVCVLSKLALTSKRIHTCMQWHTHTRMHTLTHTIA